MRCTAGRPVVAVSLLVVAVIAIVAVLIGGPIGSSGGSPIAAADEPVVSTGQVARGALSTTVSVSGTLIHRARPDGTPYVAINQAAGTYTRLPDVGAGVGCGDELYRVDDRPILLLCGAVPAYRSLAVGAVGTDVAQLNANLHALGFDAAAGVAIDPSDAGFTETTKVALAALQQGRGVDATGTLPLGAAVFLPEAARVAAVAGELGGAAVPGASVLDASSGSLEVQVALAGSQQREVATGDPVRITLPSNASTGGVVDRIGSVAEAPTGPDGRTGPGPATVRASIRLDEPSQVLGLAHAPVQVEITTGGLADVLSVPVLAIVGRSGGGYAVEVVRDGGRRELVAVELGLFDGTAGRVQVEGEVHDGDVVVVPSS